MRTLTLYKALIKINMRLLDLCLDVDTAGIEEIMEYDRRSRLADKLDAEIRERLSAPPLCWGCSARLESCMEENSHEDTWLDVTEKEPR